MNDLKVSNLFSYCSIISLKTKKGANPFFQNAIYNLRSVLLNRTSSGYIG
jgi:hypothetical protein